MREYVKRMYQERKDLEGKMKRAAKAVESNPYGMDKTQSVLLAKQLRAMKEYRDCLDERIEYEKTKE